MECYLRRKPEGGGYSKRMQEGMKEVREQQLYDKRKPDKEEELVRGTLDRDNQAED